MYIKNDEMLFLDIDKAQKICKQCRKENIKNRRLWNKKQILEKIAQENKLFCVSKLPYATYEQNSCALCHYDKECMQGCFLQQSFVHSNLGEYNLFSYCTYPSS